MSQVQHSHSPFARLQESQSTKNISTSAKKKKKDLYISMEKETFIIDKSNFSHTKEHKHKQYKP